MDTRLIPSLIARCVGLALAIGVALVAASLFAQYAASDGLDGLDLLRIALIVVSTFWLGWGAAQSFIGLFYRQKPVPRVDGEVRGRTAILMPVYNEDPVESFSRIAAMDEALSESGIADKYNFFILSDTRSEEIAQKELFWFSKLLEERNGRGRIYYRRREDNRGRKAGNIEDFFQTSGAAYDYALILDADSLMEAGTIEEMVRRMEAEPNLGLLQTLPGIINARTRFGRGMQFAASFFSPVFARGLALMQGREGPFWGHNAMVRSRAFANSCGLPELVGKPPFGGHILSHDYVEAALLARGGWQVRLDPDLEGSFEEGPENILEYAKRDRRWCQGNLQYTRLLPTPGLRLWSRFSFFQAILSYVAPLVWGVFLIAGLAAPFIAHAPDYFPEPYQLFPVFPSDETSKAIDLAVGVFGLLFLPKLLILLRNIILDGGRGFGGPIGAAISTLTELVVSSAYAPLMLMFQSRSVMQVLMGVDGGWPATQRSNGKLTLGEAWAASYWIVLFGGASLGLAWYFVPGVLLWMLPITIPMLAAPVLIMWSSRPQTGFGEKVFLSPNEVRPAGIISRQRMVFSRWTGVGSPTPSVKGRLREVERVEIRG